jgi:hypothetical protein
MRPRSSLAAATILTVLMAGGCSKAPRQGREGTAPDSGQSGSSGAAAPTLGAPAPRTSQAAPPPGAAAPGEWKRVEFAILEDYDKGESLRDVERDFALFRELGIRTWRGSFGWDDYEPKRGQFDFAWLHNFADLAERHAITLRPYIGYTPEWAAAGRRKDGVIWNDPPARIDDWREFVTALVTALRRHRNILSYEIYNEENTPQWWDGTREEYQVVLKTAADAVHAASPGTAVVLGGLVWPDPNWVESACGADPHAFDVVPFHAYPETWTPDSIRLENYLGATYRDFLSAVHDCGDKPVWINETGFATVSAKSELAQARWWARAIATFAAAPRVTEIGVYEIKDPLAHRSAIGGRQNYHLGLTTAVRKKKLAFQTVTFFVDFFRDSVLVDDAECSVANHEKEIAAPADQRATRQASRAIQYHLFRQRSGRQLLVLWTQGAAMNVDITFPQHGRKIASHGLDGRVTAFHVLSNRSLREVRLAPGDIRIITVDP